MGGLGTASAYAQAPTFSPPGLPPIPGIPGMTSSATAPIPQPPGMGIVSPPALDTSRVDAPPNPQLSDLATPPATDSATKAAAESGALSDLPPPPNPEAGDTVAGKTPQPVVTAPVTTEQAATDSATSAAPAMPGGLTLPPPPTLAGATTPALPVIPATTLPEIDSASSGSKDTVAEAPKVKTWQTTLKPTSFAYNTKFNYRRAMLPSTIYRASYNRDNSHLPVRVTREDYTYMLFERAALNDINGTRALLNAGTNINATNSRGETPLQVARRFGAVDTANLLMARGAR